MSFFINSHILKVPIIVNVPILYFDIYWDNTVLLLHGDGANNAQNNTFLDSSTNNFTITRNGTPTQGSFSPYPLNGVAYSPTLHGGSGYFNGSTDYLNAGNNSALDLRSGNFTMEAWIYLTSVSGTKSICGEWNNEQGVLAVQNGLLVFSWAPHSIYSALLTSSTSILANNWTHVAVTRSANVFTLYINGINVASASSVNATSFSQPFVIGTILIPGTGFTHFFGGYISNLRITKGLAVYTSNFTLPTSPVTLLSNGGATPSTAPTSGQVSLLCDFTNAGIFDNTKKNVLTTVGNARVSTSVVKFGTGSMYFDGTGDYLTLPSNNNFAFGTGDFTVEFWMYPTANTPWLTLCGTQPAAITDPAGWNITITNGSPVIAFWSNAQFIPAAITLNQWNYVSVTRAGTTLRMFINGTIANSTTNSQNFTYNQLGVGCTGVGIQPYNGYIDDLRITKGVARYIENFTPPTRALSDYSIISPEYYIDPYFDNVILLLNGDGPNNAQNNTFLDRSTNNFTITKNGTPTQGSFSPFELKNGDAYSPILHGGSGYFPGVNSNYLSVPSNAAFNFTSGTFTVEAWVYFNSIASGTYQNIVGNYNSITTGWIIQADNKFYLNLSGDAPDITGTTILLPNTWYHVAASGSVGSYKLFVNGVQEGSTYTGATSLAGGILGIGAHGDRPPYIGTYPVNGYISNLRITNGGAVYTSNFTPPTSPVTLLSNGGATPSTAPTSGQVSLLCDFTNGGIFDNTKKNVLTTVGDAKVSTSVVKFGTGSMYFDGTGDYLTLPASSNFAFGTGDFTVECWINPNQVNTGELGWIQTSNVSGGLSTNYTTGIVAAFRTVAGAILCNIGGTSYTTSGGLISIGNWYHFAVTRNSGTVNIWIDGTSVSSGTGNTANLTGQNLCVGGYFNTSYLYNGYIDDLRITKGVARYTANFTRPTRAFPQIKNFTIYPFIINVNTNLTGAGTSNSNQFNLALKPSTSYDFIIDWGDETIETYTTSNTTGYTHTYSSGGIYDIKIYEKTIGEFPGVYYNSTGDRLKILNITQFGRNQFGTNWSNAFAGCTNLQISATDFATAKTQNITNFDSTWNGCNNLRYFPAININGATYLDRTWSSSGLINFPLIDTSKITSFNRPWQSCNSLVTFPQINTLSANVLQNTWENCQNLVSFPAISTNNVTNFGWAWSQCTSLTSFPLIDTSKGQNFQSTWSFCTNLNSFPAINTVSATNLKQTWASNYRLKDFPLIRVPNCTSFPGTWSYCSSLTSFPNIDFSNATNFGNEGGATATGIFEGCRSISSFNIPFSATRNVTGFDRAFLFCDNLSAVPFLDYSKGTTFYATWMGPNNIKTITGNLTLSAGQNFTQAWRDCRLINSFPETYNFSSATNFSYAWYGCTSLREFNNLYAPKATNFSYAWQNCTSLSTVNLNLSAMTNGTNCFNGVKLTTTSYSSLLTSLCATNFNNSVTFHGGNSNYNSTVPQVTASRNFLVTPVVNGGRGWTITDGGPDINTIISNANQYWYTNFEAGTATKTSGYASSTDVQVVDDNGSVLGTQYYQGTKSYYCNSRVDENAGLTFVVNPTAFNNTKGFIIDFMVYKVAGDNYPTMLGIGLSSRNVLVNQQVFAKNYYGLRWLGTNYGSVIAQSTGGVTNIVSNTTSWGTVNNWHKITYYYNNDTKYGSVFVDGVQKQTALQERGWYTLPDGNILIGLFNFGTNGESSDNGIEAYIDNLGFYTL